MLNSSQCAAHVHSFSLPGSFLPRTCSNLTTRQTFQPISVVGMKIIASDNIVAEDLHNTKNLETPFYLPDMTQAFDFRWERGSDINVNIGLFNMHLIPEYRDVDHKSDNLYMQTNPNLDHDLSNFRTVRRNFCRCVSVVVQRETPRDVRNKGV